MHCVSVVALLLLLCREPWTRLWHRLIRADEEEEGALSKSPAVSVGTRADPPSAHTAKYIYQHHQWKCNKLMDGTEIPIMLLNK